MKRDAQGNWSSEGLEWVWEMGKAHGIQWLRDEAKKKSGAAST